MTDRSVLITGAASGIGRETARRFVRDGWIVGLYDRDADGLLRLADELGSDRTVCLPGDVTDSSGLAEVVDRVASRTHNALNVLFNSAGILEYADYVDTSPARKRQIIDVNINGVMQSIDAALPQLSAAADARIITMSSAGAIYGYPRSAIYSASKFFVRGLTEALNIELRANDIWVCDIMVGFVNTEMVRDPRHGIDLIKAFNVVTTPSMVADVVRQACEHKQVHWMVDDMFTAGLARSIDSLPWNERVNYMRGLLA